MAVKKKEEPEKTDGPVTDAMLDAAAINTEPQESAEPKEKPDPVEPVQAEPTDLQEPSEQAEPEPEDQTVRSELGKKVAAAHRRMDDFQNKMDGFMDEMRTMMYMQQGGQGRDPQQPYREPYAEPEPAQEETISMKTAEGWDVQIPRSEFSKLWETEATAYQKKRQTEAVKRQQRYEGLYMNAVSQLTDEIKGQDPELAEEIFSLTTDNQKLNPYNQNLSQGRDPVSDARVNVARAEAGLMRKRIAQGQPSDKVIPLKEDTPIGPLGPTVASAAAPARTMAVQLDDHAKDLVADMEKRGIKVDVEKALTGEMPSYLAGGPIRR